MPYAQQHYMGEAQTEFDPQKGLKFPAQFIAEGLDQTRGWFYSLTVLGVALFGKSPFENVIVNGTMLAEDGRKMSKSLQNYPDPMKVAHTAGVDAMRFYLLSSPVIKGEDLNFTEKEVLEIQRKNIGRLHNVLQMYDMFKDGTPADDTSGHVLDQWIIARVNQVVEEVTVGYQNYELDKATRPISDLIDDLSVWYLRRSRDRLKGDDFTDKKRALSTLRYTLRTLALTMAPVMPFYAEYLWQAIKEEHEAESIHLAAWPKAKTADAVVLGEMSIVREFVSSALEARTKANIKVRQPLAALYTNIELESEYAAIVADEINVKAVLFDADLTERIALDTSLTPELIAEGVAREFIRGVQEGRKTALLEAQDRVILKIKTTEEARAILEPFTAMIIKTVGADSIQFGDTDGFEIKTEHHSFVVNIKKL
jgi:isoleucyl-tRNA synthetase